jgi:small subunit ribosomal protein S8
MHTDPIADMLTRLRNASRARHRTVDVPSSRIKRDIARVLLAHRFIRRAVEIPDGRQGVLRLFPRYSKKDEPILSGLERISKPSLRRYAGNAELNKINRRLGITVLSTSQGVVTGRQAQRLGLGGEILFRVW